VKTLGMFLAVTAACLAAPAYAEPPRDVTVEQALALYREHSPQLAAVRAGVDVAAADLVDAHIYPNPTVELQSVGTVAGTDTIGHQQHMLSLDVPILIGHQRARRADAARAHIDSARAEVGLSEAEAELGIRERFTELLTAQAQSVVLAAAVADARGLRDIVAGRSTAGAGSEYAVERIDLAIAALASRVDEAAVEETAASGELATAVGMPGWHPHAVGDLATAAPSAPAIQTSIDPAHPALALDRAASAAARADEARAKADGIPTPSVGLQTFGTTDPGGMVVGLGLSIPLPLFDRNQGAVARARAEAHRADLELAAQTTQLDAALDRATRVLAARRDALQRFQADALQRLPKMRTMAESAYRSGQGGITELLDSFEAITDARLREIELRAAVVAAELEVRRASAGR